MSAKILVIAPMPGGPSGDPHPTAFDRPCQSGRRLAQLCGVSDVEELRERFQMINLVPEWSARWPRLVAYLRGRELELSGRAVVLLGSAVRDALLYEEREWFKWRSHREAMVCASPHTSGRSRWWNVAHNFDRAKKFWAALRERSDEISEAAEWALRATLLISGSTR